MRWPPGYYSRYVICDGTLCAWCNTEEDDDDYYTSGRGGEPAARAAGVCVVYYSCAGREVSVVRGPRGILVRETGQCGGGGGGGRVRGRRRSGGEGG